MTTKEHAKETSMLSAPSNSNHEIREAGHGRQPRLTLPTMSSNIYSSNEVGHHLIGINLSSPSLNPHPLGMKLDSVSTQQDRSTEKNTISHSGAMANHRSDTRPVAPWTDEEISNGEDVSMLWRRFAIIGRSKQDEVDGFQKKGEKNIYAAKNAISHSGAMANHRSDTRPVAPWTDKEISNGEDVSMLWRRFAIGRSKQDEVGFQKKGEKNIHAAKIAERANGVALSLSTGEEPALVLENVVVPPSCGGGLKKNFTFTDLRQGEVHVPRAKEEELVVDDDDKFMDADTDVGGREEGEKEQQEENYRIFMLLTFSADEEQENMFPRLPAMEEEEAEAAFRMFSEEDNDDDDFTASGDGTDGMNDEGGSNNSGSHGETGDGFFELFGQEDVSMLWRRRFAIGRSKQDEVDGFQKKREKNISTAKIAERDNGGALSLSTGEEPTLVLENVVVPPSCGGGLKKNFTILRQ